MDTIEQIRARVAKSYGPPPYTYAKALGLALDDLRTLLAAYDAQAAELTALEETLCDGPPYDAAHKQAVRLRQIEAAAGEIRQNVERGTTELAFWHDSDMEAWDALVDALKGAGDE